MSVLAEIGIEWMANNHIIQDPGSGGTFNQVNMAWGVADIASGTRKLPDNGYPMIVRATGAVTINSAAGTTVATLASGQAALFVPQSSTTWTAIILEAGTSLSQTEIGTALASTQGFVDLPLTSWREVTSNDISDAGVGAADSSGGVLATDTTPALEYVNADTDSQIRLLWAASNQDPIARQIMLPLDLDRTQPILVKIRGKMSGTSNSPVMDADTFFGEAGTKIEDATATNFSDAVDLLTITIAAADIPTDVVGGALPMSIELTPGAHGTDTLAVYGIYLQYTKKLLTS